MTYQEIFAFEHELATYTGARYAVLTDCCTHAIELAMRYDEVKACSFTAFTYVSVVQCLRHLHINYELTDEVWRGEYQFQGTRIWDSARRLEPGMYRPGQVQCLSFGNTKPLQIGRVGAMLLDDLDAYRALSRMRSDGRDLNVIPWTHQHTFQPGWHYCPMLEDVARGRALLARHKPQCHDTKYPDLRLLDFVS